MQTRASGLCCIASVVSLALAIPAIAIADEPDIQLAEIPEEIEHGDIYSISGTFTGLPASDTIEIEIVNKYMEAEVQKTVTQNYSLIPSPSNRPSGAFSAAAFTFKGPGRFNVFVEFSGHSASNDQEGDVAAP